MVYNVECVWTGLNARNVSFRISLRWPIHIFNSVDKTKLYFKTYLAIEINLTHRKLQVSNSAKRKVERPKRERLICRTVTNRRCRVAPSTPFYKQSRTLCSLRLLCPCLRQYTFCHCCNFASFFVCSALGLLLWPREEKPQRSYRLHRVFHSLKT